MQHEDLRKLIKELQGPSVRLPLHQKALRERLVEVHPTGVHGRRSLSARLAALWAQLIAAVAQKAMPLGALLIAVMVLLGLLLLLPSSQPPSGERIIAKAPKGNPTTNETAVNTAVCGPSSACYGVAGDQESSSPPAGSPANKPNPAMLDNTTTRQVALRMPIGPAAPLNDAVPAPIVAAEVVATPPEIPILISAHVDITEILTGNDKDKSKNEKDDKEAKEDKTPRGQEKKNGGERTTAGL